MCSEYRVWIDARCMSMFISRHHALKLNRIRERTLGHDINTMASAEVYHEVLFSIGLGLLRALLLLKFIQIKTCRKLKHLLPEQSCGLLCIYIQHHGITVDINL